MCGGYVVDVVDVGHTDDTRGQVAREEWHVSRREGKDMRVWLCGSGE